ncbi:MAG: TAXI family TRAP transporter solute-binding subunit [Janthinobacterium lividum]
MTMAVAGQARRELVLTMLAAPVAAGTSRAAAAERDARPPPRRANPVIPDAQVAAPNALLGFVSGGLSGTYLRIAADVAAVFAVDRPQMRVLPIAGRGSLQNVSDILNARDVDVGIVQSDVLASLRRDRSLAGLETSLGYLAKLYDEEVHILARAAIGGIADLRGKRVNVDVRGSGTALTAAVMFDALDIRPVLLNDDAETALAKLQRGEIDALVYVAGKPARLFTGDCGSGLHLLALPADRLLLQSYVPSRFSHADYPGLIAPGATVDTLAVGAVLAVYNWQPGSERYIRLSRFVDALFERLPVLQAAPRHPKWREVSLTAQVPGWTRFAAAQAWLQQRGAGAGEPAKLRL